MRASGRGGTATPRRICSRPVSCCFGYLAGCTTKLGFSTGVLILPQRQTLLVAKQAPPSMFCAAAGSGSASGSGWNEGRVHRPQREFPQPRPALEEQVQVMQALWARAARHL